MLSSNIFNLRDRVAVVTGATGQLGQAMIAALSANGVRTYGIDLDVARASAPATKYLCANVASQAEVAHCITEVLSAEPRIDILVNNAGVSVFEPFEQRTEERFDWVLGVNLKGVFNCIQSYVAGYDRTASKQGRIVNIGSHYGIISPDFRIYSDGDRKNSEVYGATKAGVIQMTKYFAVHLAGRGITVNCISPGGVYNPKQPQSSTFRQRYSERVPLGRMGNQEELLGALIYLASDASSYTTGHNLVVDGGMSCW